MTIFGHLMKMYKCIIVFRNHCLSSILQHQVICHPTRESAHCKIEQVKRWVAGRQRQKHRQVQSHLQHLSQSVFFSFIFLTHVFVLPRLPPATLFHSQKVKTFCLTLAAADTLTSVPGLVSGFSFNLSYCVAFLILSVHIKARQKLPRDHTEPLPQQPLSAQQVLSKDQHQKQSPQGFALMCSTFFKCSYLNCT